MYHAVTIGGITADLVRRATGGTIGQFLAAEVAGPLGADVHIGLDASEDERLAVQVIEAEPQPAADPSDEASYWSARAMTFGPLDRDTVNAPWLHRGELAGVGGVATAAGLAKFWSATVVDTDGIRLISESTADALRARRSFGPGYFAGTSAPPFQAWGAGVMVPSDWDPYLSPASFGHDGAGGQIGFADPASRIGFAYLTNRWGDWHTRDLRDRGPAPRTGVTAGPRPAGLKALACRDAHGDDRVQSGALRGAERRLLQIRQAPTGRDRCRRQAASTRQRPVHEPFGVTTGPG
jgi:CubicO group peptidase (beta-lactamase class C family)